MSNLRFLILVCAVANAIGTSAELCADETADLAFFDTQVLPILRARCYACHSHESGKSKGGLVVDSKTGWSVGGESGPAIVPGDPDGSLLIEALRRGDAASPMPPDNALPAAEVAIFEQWIRRGAADPRQGEATSDSFAAIMQKAKTHWSLQPIVKPTIPASAHEPNANPIDAFVAQKRAARGLRAAADAAPRELMRRLSFDLVGLPPTCEQIQHFEQAYATNADRAIAAYVDELLASPHYGERWGRHWLDLARYAEVSGGAANRARETRLLNAFTYRDYVIRALNADKPYDRFVIEQLAADQTELNDPRDLAALGFLPVGSQEGSMQEVRAERIDTIGKVFLGLTLGCARCHDHKFDPISTADFYALDGVLLSTREIGVPRFKDPVGDLEACPVIAETKDPALLAARTAAIAKAQQAIAAYEQELWGPAEVEWRKQTPQVWRVLAMESKDFGPLGQRDYLRKHDLSLVLVGAWQKWLANEAKQTRRGTHPIFGPWFELSRLKPSAFDIEAKQLLASYTDDSSINRYVLQALRAKSLRSKQDVAAAYADLLLAVDHEWQQNVQRAALPDADREALRQVFYGAGTPTARDPVKWRNFFGNEADTNRNRLLAKLNDAAFQSPGSPQRAMALHDRNPQDAHILIRGEADQRGDRVPRGFVAIFGREGRRLTFPPGTSGRLELAQAIVDPANPLTARVVVNRIWTQHFGSSLVDSVDDFGLQTPEPEHRALLDWLAATFVEEGWSLKKLHRRLLLSRVYRQSSTEHADYVGHADRDPDNALLWRSNVRRLDFEALRDAVLKTCGTLDPTVYGRSVELIDDPAASRRTVYAWIDRPAQPLLSMFDVPDNSVTAANRHESTSPGQALFLMNGGFVEHHAARLLQSADFREQTTDDRRIAWLFRQLLQRDATTREVATFARFVDRDQGEETAWLEVVQTLLMSNEFSYIL